MDFGAFLNAARQGAGNTIDDIGTNLNLDGFGLSEFIAGGKPTSNTGRIQENGLYNISPTTRQEPTPDDPTPTPKDIGDLGDLGQLTSIYGYGGGSGGTSGGTSYSAADLAYLEDQIAEYKRQLGRTDTALEQGLSNLGDSYNKELSRQNQLRGRALEDFTTQRSDTELGKNQALGRVDTNARTLADSLRRRLGLASGADSSAFKVLSPYAVSREASTQRTGVLGDYGQNFRDLDTAESRTKTDFENLLEDLAAQKRSQESSLRSGVLQQKNQISSQLADAAREKALLLGGGYDGARAASAGYVDDIRSRESALDKLFSQFRNPYQVQDVKVNAPNLRDYTVDKAAINANNQYGTNDNSPYAQLLKRQQEEER